MKKLAAEFFGTFWLVLGGCGSAVLAAAFPEVGIGLVGVSLAFGLTVLTMAYAVGHISGGHFNPAVSVGLATAGRFSWSALPGYVIAQCAGAVVAALVLYLIATGKADVTIVGGFASNGYGEHSPGKFSLFAALLTEVVMTAGFLIVILGSTHKNASAGFAPIAIGLALTLIHLVSIPRVPTQHIREPRPLTRRGAVCRRLGAAAALAVHRCSSRGCDYRCRDPQGVAERGLS